MTKRPGLTARSDVVKAALQAHGSADRASAPEPSPPEAEPESGKGGKPRLVGQAVRLPEATHLQLMDLAHDLSKEKRRRVSVHSLLLEGVDLVLQKYGRN